MEAEILPTRVHQDNSGENHGDDDEDVADADDVVYNDAGDVDDDGDDGGDDDGYGDNYR